jgi:AraC-like DNA-binding protein
MALTRSEIRRLRLFELEHVQHHQPGQEWVPHWHDEWSFGAIVEGTCRCSVAGQPFRAQTGDVLAIAPGVVHTGALTSPADSRTVLVTMLYVPDTWMDQMGLTAPARSGRIKAPMLCRDARDLETAEAARDWLSRAVPVLAKALRPKQPGEREATPSAAVRDLIARVRAGVMAGEQTVSGLARQCAVSRERLHRVLTQWVGMTPADYLRAVRLHRAKQLVLDGEPVAIVAAECGFADQAHFTRWFRRAFGYTPGDLVQAAMSTTRAIGVRGT